MGSGKNHDALLRQWLLLNRIPRRVKRGTKYFQEVLRAAGFDVTLRTVQRDLEALSCHFPLQRDDERISGWKWSEDASAFDVPGMDPHVALAFQMIKLHLRGLLPESSLDFLKPYNKRAKEILDELEGSGLAKWPKKIARISRHISLESPRVNPYVHNVIYDGLLLERQLEISYQNRESEIVQEAKIHPLGLVFVDNVEYLVCTFWDYGDLRQLALHRIESAKFLDETSRRPLDFDLNKYIEQGHFGFPQSEEKINLRCLIDRSVAKHLEESPLNHGQQLSEQGDGWVLLEAEVMDTAQLQWWILGFGDQIEVLGPEELREKVALVCQKMADHYA